MAKISMIIFATVLCMMLVTPHAQTLSCSSVVKCLNPCMNYLKDGGPVPANCCSGVKALKSAASTPAARRSACECIKSAAKAYSVNPQYAAALPKACSVTIGYPISYNTNCNNVQ